jgi:hypothetical protein
MAFILISPKDIRLLEMERRAPEAPDELNRSGTRREGDAFGGLPRLPAV